MIIDDRVLQLKKKVSQNRTKLQQTTKQQTTKQQTNNKRPFFLPKKKVFLRPILQNLNGQIFFEIDPLDEPNQMRATKQKVLSLQEEGQRRKMVIKI